MLSKGQMRETEETKRKYSLVSWVVHVIPKRHLCGEDGGRLLAVVIERNSPVRYQPRTHSLGDRMYDFSAPAESWVCLGRLLSASALRVTDDRGSPNQATSSSCTE